jgi:hypothetical protein
MDLRRSDTKTLDEFIYDDDAVVNKISNQITLSHGGICRMHLPFVNFHSYRFSHTPLYEFSENTFNDSRMNLSFSRLVTIYRSDYFGSQSKQPSRPAF